MKRGPFTVNVEALAAGILQIIDEHRDGACLTLGMLPADVMFTLDRLLEEKIPDTYYDPDGATLEDRIRTDGAEIRREVSRAVSVAILRQASEQGKCLV
jgi:hypothetical protein